MYSSAGLPLNCWKYVFAASTEPGMCPCLGFSEAKFFLSHHNVYRVLRDLTDETVPSVFLGTDRGAGVLLNVKRAECL
jgi:hypothetical protein